MLDLARQHLAAVEERIAQLARFRDQLAGEIHKWDGTRHPTCEGLCEIISGAATIAPLEVHPPRRR